MKCLVKEAEEKCKCKDCQERRKWLDEHIKQIIKWEILRTRLELLRETRGKNGTKIR